MIRPISVNFEITNACDANCKFCSIKEQKVDKKCFELNKLKRLVDIFDENSLLKINLFGGEPLVYDRITELSRYIKKKNFHLTLVTNGIALDKDIEELSEYIDIIGVSIHGLHEMHDNLIGVKGSFDKIISNFSLLKKYNCRFGINFTVTAINYNSIIETVDFLMDNGIMIDFVALNRYVENKYLDENINNELKVDAKLLNKTLSSLNHLNLKYPNLSLKYAVHFPHCLVDIKENLKFVSRCGFGENYCSVNGDGNFKLCSWSETILGNLFNESMDKIWNSNSIIDDYRSEKWMHNTCQRCGEKTSCMSGCKLSSAIEPFSSDILMKSEKRTLTPKLTEVRIRREPKGYYVVMNKNGRLLKINETGKFIIEQCNGHNEEEVIANLLCSKYDIPFEKAFSDVTRFTGLLKKSKLLKY